MLTHPANSCSSVLPEHACDLLIVLIRLCHSQKRDSLSATMLNYVNKRWSERENWLRNTGTEQERGETESTKIMKRQSSSAPLLTTEPSGLLLRRKSMQIYHDPVTDVCVYIVLFCICCLLSVINQQQKNDVSWSRSPSSWEVTWSTLTWWKVWISLCCRRWVERAGRSSVI